MKYPVDIDGFIAECATWYPDNELVVPVFRAFLPMVNEAYAQGVNDGKETASTK